MDDHQKKSYQVKKLRKKLKNKAKNTVNRQRVLLALKQRLNTLQNESLDPYDETCYDKLAYEKEGRILELQNVIWLLETFENKDNKRRF